MSEVSPTRNSPNFDGASNMRASRPLLHLQCYVGSLGWHIFQIYLDPAEEIVYGIRAQQRLLGIGKHPLESRVSINLWGQPH